MTTMPHLTYLRSFEAAARHLSFTAAAEELNCTQSAVSNHVRSLEDFLGRPLFRRHTRSLSLTDVGSAYLPSVRHALQKIESATASLISQTHGRDVALSCPTSLAESWLPGVIADFVAEHPDVGITIHCTIWTDMKDDVADIAITTNHEDDVDLGAIKLWDDSIALVAAPDFRIAGQPLSTPAQLQDAPLFQVLGRTLYWDLVGDALGLDGLGARGQVRTSSSNIALEMAARGMGCAALPRSLVMPYLDRGLVVEPFAIRPHCPWGYYLSFSDRSATPSVRAFGAWLLDAARGRGA
ncbi:MAG: LysR substrate-binding domain-containing protein [Marinibacterium sp.]|nr:LysR substrate-binding domain-containing protein [Marinibacterium sp.]